MISTEKNIYIQETEVKPNTYSLTVLRFCLVGILSCWMLNEIGIFRVGKLEMRIGSLVPLLSTLTPLIVIRTNKKLLENTSTKYYIIASAIILSATVGTLLTFHTTIMLLFPIFIAMLYRSERLGRIAMTGSLFCTVFTPIIGYLLKTWDIDLFKELILIGANANTELTAANLTPGEAIFKILLYLSFPRMIMVGSCSLLLFYVIRLSSKHVQNQILLDQMSHRDALTGFYNQNYYKEIVNSNELSGQVGVLFFDVNGLKEANDLKGHEYGDLLLQKCSKSIQNVLTENRDYGFRIGGDEFVVITEGADEQYINDKINKWQKSLKTINEENEKSFNGLTCSIACGNAIGDFSNIDDLVRKADEMMYQNKEKKRSKQKHA